MSSNKRPIDNVELIPKSWINIDSENPHSDKKQKIEEKKLIGKVKIYS